MYGCPKAFMVNYRTPPVSATGDQLGQGKLPFNPRNPT
jgi:hypothetical protein